MNQYKPWYASKTIWASLVSLAAAIGAGFGVEIDQQMQTTFVETALQLAAVTGSVIAVVGRVSATSLIE